MWTGRVPPNNWYGFRTRRTLSNEHLWYAANRVAGRDLFVAGLAVVIAVFMMPQVQYELGQSALWFAPTVFVIAVVGAVTHSFLALSRMDN